MNLILKYLLFPLLLLLTALPIQAEEDKWIDGIKFRNGILNNEAAFKFEDSASIYTIIKIVILVIWMLPLCFRLPLRYPKP